MSLVGQPAPAWTSTAYWNGSLKPLTSADLEGRWYVLYWYPFDFSTVCPTEINGFESLLGDFSSDNIALIGASTDSFFSHQTWFGDRQTFPQEITHPVLADTNHTVSKAFSVLKHDLGVAYRATVIVDVTGRVRSIAVNDLDVGRSPMEVLRTARALQSGGSCAADWKKGDAFAG